MFEEWQAFILARIEFSFKLAHRHGWQGPDQEGVVEGLKKNDESPPANDGDTGSVPGPGSHIPRSN